MLPDSYFQKYIYTALTVNYRLSTICWLIVYIVKHDWYKSITFLLTEKSVKSTFLLPIYKKMNDY